MAGWAFSFRGIGQSWRGLESGFWAKHSTLDFCLLHITQFVFKCLLIGSIKTSARGILLSFPQTERARDSVNFILFKFGGVNNIIILYIYKITELLRALSFDRCVKMRVCKHGCDVSDLCVSLKL